MSETNRSWTGWPWIQRTFDFSFPAEKFPDCLERLRGTPARLSSMLAGVENANAARTDGQGWSIKQNVGHLTDTEILPESRIDEILEGREFLTAADMSNTATQEADHNARPLSELLDAFATRRGALCARFASLPQEAWSLSSHHRRIDKPMRLVDLVYFTSEHDDYHLARIRWLLHWLARGDGD